LVGDKTKGIVVVKIKREKGRKESGFVVKKQRERSDCVKTKEKKKSEREGTDKKNKLLQARLQVNQEKWQGQQC